MIPQSFIQDLLNRIDIVEVVGRHVQLKKGGANFMGLCPFHSEKSPSFTVSPTKQFYHCFGCGAHGSAIGFLMEHGGLSYVEAIEELAQSAGLTVPREGPRLSPEQQAQKRAQTVSLGDALAKASQYYRQQLKGAKRAIDYLKGRGLSGEIAARFGLGYAPDGWQNLEAVFGGYRGDVAKALVESGLVIESDRAGNDGEPRRYDRFRDRVMFPIRNAKGAIIGFGGRVLDAGEPKYLNSPETPLFSKGTELYGLFEARDAIRAAGYALVTEGYMDVVALAQLGFANAVATLGTACTPIHVQKLFRQTDTVVFSFDGDAAGRRAARRALEASLPHLGDDKTVRFLFLPAEHDPDSYVRTFGTDAFAAEVAQAMPLSRFLLKIVTDGRDLRQAEDRARAQHDAKPLLQALPAGALRLQIVRVVAEATGSTPAEIEVLCELRRAVSSRAAPPRAKRQPPAGLDQQLLRLLLRFPVLAQILNGEVRGRLTAPEYPQAELFADLLHHCDDSPPEIGFAAFHERLARSPLAPAYQPLIASVVGDDVALAAAQDELHGVVRKLLLQALETEQNQLAQALQHSGGSDADKARYRANAQRIVALREGRETP